jgi:hypothetical protein
MSSTRLVPMTNDQLTILMLTAAVLFLSTAVVVTFDSALITALFVLVVLAWSLRLYVQVFRRGR